MGFSREDLIDTETMGKLETGELLVSNGGLVENPYWKRKDDEVIDEYLAGSEKWSKLGMMSMHDLGEKIALWRRGPDGTQLKSDKAANLFGEIDRLAFLCPRLFSRGEDAVVSEMMASILCNVLDVCACIGVDAEDLIAEHMKTEERWKP